jgi:FkbM family methyltransferase
MTSIKRFLRRFGYDVVTYRPFLELLPKWGIKTVLDVGANEGQFAMELRSAGYTGAIFSFEPTRKAFECLKNNSRNDARWQVVNSGLGSTNEKLIVAVPEDSRLTSVLPPTKSQLFSGEETIRLQRLDIWLSEMSEIKIDLSTTCLKLDVQGYESEVLEGAGNALPQFGAIMAELAICQSYEAQPYIDDIIPSLRNKGFDLWVTRRGLWTPHGNREFEIDGLFRNRHFIT